MLASDAHSIPWSTFARLNDEVGAALGNDPERLRLLGRGMAEVPSFGPLRRIARTVISVEALYDIAQRWFGRANFPHLRLVQQFERDHLFVHGVIPRAYEGSEAFLRISCGSVEAIPTFLGLPPSELIESRIDARSADIELRVPKNRSLVQRAVMTVNAVVHRKQRAAILERERQLLDAGLAASERARDELRTVLERLPALVVIHVEGRIVFVNRSFARTLGWRSPSDLIGRPLIESIDPRSHAQFLEHSKMPAEAHPSLDTVEAWLVTKTGDPVLIESAQAQAIVFDGVPARLVVGRDIDERDRLQKQLATADRLAALGLLAAGVAHEVNNPLAYVLNNIEIAQKQLAALGQAADGARNALQIATEGAHRIRFIVRELLLLAREEPTAGATDLAAAVESTLALARVEIEKTARLVTELEPVPPVRGSVPRVAQIVLNLVLNSLEAMKGRDHARNQLTIRVGRAGDDSVLLEIADNGIGVEGPDAARIFLPFFTTKPAGCGTGLGLAVTQRLVNELGGDISFTSERGVGTTFRVLFPVFADERAPFPRSSAPRAG
jgi:PAS domain S-box-containing protein